LTYRSLFSQHKLTIYKSVVLFLTGFCFFSFIILHLPGPAAAQTDSTDNRPLPADIRVEGDFLHPQLVVAGQVVLDQAGARLSHPQISPDGERIAVALIPSGTETDRWSQLFLIERKSGRLLGQFSGHSPRWRDTQTLSYETKEGRILYDVVARQSILESLRKEDPRLLGAGLDAQTIAYPATIRVLHHPQNTCRPGVPAGRVDVIPFEEYVARSVPAEMPASWSLDALKAQAITARTYGWYQIRTGPRYSQTYNVTYDVTDWANFQMMCDYSQRPARSDLAVTQTAGHYLSAQADSQNAPIIAMYSAKNGHPTLDNPNEKYLRGVPDFTGLGEERWGHGFGLSQWGAQRRTVAGHNYRQILGHYYTGVHLQNALNPFESMGGISGIEPNGYLPPGGLRWSALAPAAPLASQIVVQRSASSAHGQAGDELLTRPGRSGVWHDIWPLEEDAQVSVTLWLAGSPQDEIQLSVDRTPPAPPNLSAPATSEIAAVNLSVTAPPEERIGLSNAWVWQGESLSAPAGSSTVAAEAGADGGAVRLGRPGEHQAGLWYGPYATGIPAKQSYRALFRLRMGNHPARAADGMVPNKPVARLDVTDRGGSLRLGLRDLWASDFLLDGGYVEIPVDFHIFEAVTGLEFRVHWNGEVELALDRVRVFALLNGGAQNLEWPLSPGAEATVTAVSFDRAGNVSVPVARTVRIIDEIPPTIETIHWPQGWQTRLPITLTAVVQDRGGGLAMQSGVLLINGDPAPATFSKPNDPWARQELTAILPAIEEGEHTLRFRLADQAGNVRESEEATLRVDLTRPTVSAHLLWPDDSPLDPGIEWLDGPVQVTLEGIDMVSGLSAIAYVLNKDPFVLYTEPFTVALEGHHSIRYWAQDKAGNYSLSELLNFGIDLTPPTVTIFVLSGNAESVTIGWRAEDLLSGVASIEVEKMSEDGSWEALGMDHLAAGRVLLYFEEEEEISLRSRATDNLGHESAWTLFRTGPIDNVIYLPYMAR
jgi:hypothetical protein